MELKAASKTPFCSARQTLRDTECGQVVKIGEREYIVLAHMGNSVAVITKEFATKMRFGDDGDYRTSDVRKYCIGEFYQKLSEVVGEDNIIPHEVDLTSDNGSGKGIGVTDTVSILTTERYRRYVEYLPPYGDWWWTATRVDVRDPDYARYVCCVNSYGVLHWCSSGCSSGVRPFCILNSSVSVS